MTSQAKPADLLVLAERLEQASAEQQRMLLIIAFDALFPNFHETIEEIRGRNLGRFFGFIDVGAFESAAMLLVPEGWTVQITASLPVSHAVVWNFMKSTGYVRGHTPALALTAASLRASAQHPSEG